MTDLSTNDIDLEMYKPLQSQSAFVKGYKMIVINEFL